MTNKFIGYIRVSTNMQDTKKQKHLILEYAHKNDFKIDKFIEVEISSKKSEKQRRIDELKDMLKKDDTLIVAELSRLGRNMLDVMNLISYFNDEGVKLIFIRQPELNTFDNAQGMFMVSIYGYFAQTEREFISLRTKQGLAAAKASGKKLGRQKGAKIKSKFDPYKEQIKELLLKDISITSIYKLIDIGSYVGIRNYILKDNELNQIIRQNRNKNRNLLVHK